MNCSLDVSIDGNESVVPTDRCYKVWLMCGWRGWIWTKCLRMRTSGRGTRPASGCSVKVSLRWWNKQLDDKEAANWRFVSCFHQYFIFTFVSYLPISLYADKHTHCPPGKV